MNIGFTKNKKIWIIILSLVLVTVLTLLTTLTSRNPEVEQSVINESGSLIINKEDITKTASFYPYVSNETYMEIIAVRANDGTVRTALNTCQVCYNSGRGYYEQLGDKLICKNCGNQFTIDQIEVIKGGCNPVPILDEMKEENDETITINPEALVVFEPLFSNWKK